MDGDAPMLDIYFNGVKKTSSKPITLKGMTADSLVDKVIISDTTTKTGDITIDNVIFSKINTND